MYHGLRLKYHHFWHEAAHTLAILFLFTWGVFHDSKRLRIYALLFFSNVRAFAICSHPSIRRESTGWAINAQG